MACEPPLWPFPPRTHEHSPEYPGGQGNATEIPPDVSDGCYSLIEDIGHFWEDELSE